MDFKEIGVLWDFLVSLGGVVLLGEILVSCKG